MTGPGPSSGPPAALLERTPEGALPLAGPGHFVWRARALLLFALGGIALAAGVALRSSAAVLLATPLLLAPASTWILAPRGGTVVHLRSEVSDAGEDLALELHLRAVPPIAGGSLDLEMDVPAGTVAVDGVVRRLVVDGGRIPSTRLLFRPFRPVFLRLRPPRLRWRDPLGLGELQLQVRDPGTTLERYPPEVRRIPRLSLQRTTPLPGEVRSRRRAAQGEFTSVRPYAPGDARRQINWWATARRGHLACNDFLAERSGELILVVDARPTGLGGDDDEQLLGVARAAALGLARYMVREKTRVGLVVFGEFARCVPLGTGRLQRYRIEQELEIARVAEISSPIERLSVSLGRHFPRGTPVLLITPMTDEETVAAGFFLRRRGFPCLLLTPSPATLEAERMDLRSLDGPLALRLLRLLRRRQLSEAWQNAPVVEWEDFTTLAALVAFLRRPPSAPSGGAS